MRSHKIAKFDKYFFTHSDLNFEEIFEERGELDVSNIELIIEQIKKHASEFPDFYEKYDYDWAFIKENYNYNLEAYLQLKVLRILAGVRSDRDRNDQLDNIAIRLLPFGEGSMKCVFIDEMKFVVIASSYTILLRELLFYVSMVLRKGAMIGLDNTDADLKSVFGGVLILKAFKSDFPFSFIHSLRFYSVIKNIVEYKKVDFKNPIVSNSLSSINPGDDRLSLMMKHLVHWMEMFAISHELVHFIDHDLLEPDRVLDKELDADMYALSILTIHSSMELKYNPYNDRHLGWIFGSIMSLMIGFVRESIKFQLNYKLVKDKIPYEDAMKEMIERLKLLFNSFKYINDGIFGMNPIRLSGTFSYCFYDAQTIYLGLLSRFFLQEFIDNPSLKSPSEFVSIFEENYGVFPEKFFELEFSDYITQKREEYEFLLRSKIPNIISEFGTTYNTKYMGRFISDLGLEGVIFKNHIKDK